MEIATKSLQDEASQETTPKTESIPASNPTPMMMEVVAPADLPEGYTFTAELAQGRPFVAVVVSVVR